MRLRTFTAPNMQVALKQVRDELGDNAIILNSQTHKGKGVSVTAAVEADDGLRMTDHSHSTSSSVIHHPPSEPFRFQIQEILRFHNIPELFITKIMNADPGALTSPDMRSCLEKLLAAYFTFSPLDLPSPTGRGWREAPGEGSAARKRPHPNPLPEGEGTIMLIGPPGIGKTLTIARIAAGMMMNGQQALVITTDNKRAGGVEQLQAFTDILGIPLAVAGSPKELQQRLKDAHTFALIDTAGCNPYDSVELRELAGFAKQIGIEPVLAMAAGGDSLEAVDAVEAFMDFPVKRLLITKADTARRFGGALAAAAAHGLAFCHTSNSSSIADPLLPVDEALLAQLLLRYQLQT